MTRRLLVSVILGGALIIVLLRWAGNLAQQRTQAIAIRTAPSVRKLFDPPRTVQPKDLYAEFNANEVAAEEKFKGHLVIVHGRAASIRRDSAGTAVVGFDYQVICRFSAQNDHDAARIKPTQIVKIIGICRGKSNGNVIVEDAHLIEIESENGD